LGILSSDEVGVITPLVAIFNPRAGTALSSRYSNCAKTGRLTVAITPPRPAMPYGVMYLRN
jgi:hypothetical protein